MGTKFMGKAHSNAWKNVGHFFDTPIMPVLKVAVGRNERALKEFAERWGWEETETDWKKVVSRKDIDIIDVSMMASAFDSTPGTPKWNPNADLNNNGIVDIVDLSIAAFDFGAPVFS